MSPVHPLLIAAIAFGIVLVQLALLALWFWRARDRRGKARLRKSLRYPVVLAHGLMGFDELKLGSMRREYFRGVQARLVLGGETVHTVRVSAAGSVEVRAQQLAKAVRALGVERVNIIAHSMGGLDSRFAISRLGLSDKVASLTTIGTPHGGSPIADLGAGLGSLVGLKRALDVLGVDVGAFYDVTTARMAAFNLQVPDVRSVTYNSVISRISGSLARVNPVLLPLYLYLSRKAGENDGIVPSTSQGWGEVVQRIDADHWAQIGWSTTRFDAPGFYAELIEALKGRGL